MFIRSGQSYEMHPSAMSWQTDAKSEFAWISNNIEPPLSVDCDDFKCVHDDVIKWKHFPHYWPFVRRIHRSTVNSPHKGQWRGAWVFPLICAWINVWANNREAGDLRRHRAHYEVTVMSLVEKPKNVDMVTCSNSSGKPIGIVWLYVTNREVYFPVLTNVSF